MTDRVSILEKIQSEARNLFKKKNQDYGDAFANYGPIGVLVRIGDKISRLQSITTNQISLVNTESLRDTLIDLHNYSAMAIMLLDENPTSERIKYPTPVSTPQNSPEKSKTDKTTVNYNKEISKSSTSFLGNITIQDLE